MTYVLKVYRAGKSYTTPYIVEVGYAKPNVLKKKAMELIKNPDDTVDIISLNKYIYNPPFAIVPTSNEHLRSIGIQTDIVRMGGPPTRNAVPREIIGTVSYNKELGKFTYTPARTYRGSKSTVVLNKNGYPDSKKKSKNSDDFTWDTLSKIDRIKYN